MGERKRRKTLAEAQKVLQNRLDAMVRVYGRLDRGEDDPIQTDEERAAVRGVLGGTIEYWARRAKRHQYETRG